jgi:hypothetical protein
MRTRNVISTRTITLVALSLLTLPYILGVIGGAMMAWASPLIILDGPADTGACIAFLTICTCPLVFAVALAGGWLCFLLKQHRLALILASIPLLEGLAVLIAGIVFKGVY